MLIDISAIFEKFSTLNVLVVGDVMIDRYVYGEVSRISPEAPVPVVGVQRTEDRLGGAANVALNIKALGATPWLCSIIGEDENADKFGALLPSSDLPDKGIIRSSERPTTVKTRIVAQNQHLIRLDEESTHTISTLEQQRLRSTIRKIMDHTAIDVILIQDYNKGVLDISIIQFLLAESAERKIPVAVDPKDHNFWAYKGVSLFKPNLAEVSRALGYKVPAIKTELRKAAYKIREMTSAEYILITLSEKGAYIDQHDDCLLVPTRARQIADVSGAGDSVISMAALALALDISPENMAILANMAGGQVCERFGVVPIDPFRLLEETRQILKESEQNL